jgi:hypothetical protein
MGRLPQAQGCRPDVSQARTAPGLCEPRSLDLERIAVLAAPLFAPAREDVALDQDKAAAGMFSVSRTLLGGTSRPFAHAEIDDD